VVENSGPVSVTLKCVSGAGGQHTTRITLFRDSDRVAIQNDITENFSDVRHWAFSFNLSSPDVHTEEVGAVIRAKTKSNGGDYADTHGRYDYVTLNHFADITDGANTYGVTLANADCAFAKLGRSSATNLDTATPQINVLAGGQVDGSWLGIRGQNGATHFLQRFALCPHGSYDQAGAMKAALEFQNPLVTAPIIGVTNSTYPATNHSILGISNPNVLLWALKPHDDGIEHGFVARVWNQSSEPSHVRFTAIAQAATVRRITHVETDREPLRAGEIASEIILPMQHIESFLLKLKK
jgi:alpha-mannosidase